MTLESNAIQVPCTYIASSYWSRSLNTLIIWNKGTRESHILMAAETICMGLLLLCWIIARLYRIWQKRDGFLKLRSHLSVCWNYEWKIYYQIASDQNSFLHFKNKRWMCAAIFIALILEVRNYWSKNFHII